MALLKPEWMPDAKAKRVICHWTGGGPKASELDREHYHVLVQPDLKLIRGVHSIADNDRTNDGDYAAHTLSCNQGSIGISLCGMLNAVESPFNPGPHPIREPQWDLAAQVVAELCQRYDIPVTPQAVLQHGEVQKNLGITQRAKWDVCRLPWQPDWNHSKVCDDFRARVLSHIGEQERPAEITAVILGTVTNGLLQDGQSLVAIRPLISAGLMSHIYGFDGVSAPESILTTIKGHEAQMPFYNVEGTGYVPARALAKALGANVGWDAKAKRVTVA